MEHSLNPTGEVAGLSIRAREAVLGFAGRVSSPIASGSLALKHALEGGSQAGVRQQSPGFLEGMPPADRRRTEAWLSGLAINFDREN